VRDEKIARAVTKVFSFKPADIVGQLNLLRPIYRQTTNYGHFGKAGLPWEQTNKVAALRAAGEVSVRCFKPIPPVSAFSKRILA
jgi:S-adenosylmethionine synthetase